MNQTTIAVLDADQLREIIRTEFIRALDEFRAIFQTAELDAGKIRNRDEVDGLITADTLAEITGIATRELRRLVHEGLFPAPIRLGTRRIRWKRKEVIEWMDHAPRSTQPPLPVRPGSRPERLAPRT